MSRLEWLPARLRSALGPILYFAVSTALFFRGVLFARHEYHIPYDLYDYHYPLSELIAWSLRQFGRLPWWNPFSYCGEPLSGNITTAIFYPTTLFSILLGNVLHGRLPYRYMELQVIGHVFFAGLGMYVLLRGMECGRAGALLGATVFQLGAFFTTQTQHLGAVCGAAWLPWLALAARYLARRLNFAGVAAVASVLALMVLAGFPAVFLPAYVFAGVWVLCWSWPENGPRSKVQGPKSQAADSPTLDLGPWTLDLVRWLAKPCVLYLAACLLSIGLAAAVLLPAFDVARLSVATLRPRSQAIDGFRWEALTSLLLPNLFSQLRGPYWGTMNLTFMYLYQGLPALLLAAAAMALRPARRLAVFWISAAFAFLWMFGDTFGISEAIYVLSPGFVGRGVYPPFILAYFCLAFAALAGMALEAMERGELEPRWRPWRAVGLAAVGLGIVFYGAMAFLAEPTRREPVLNVAATLLYAGVILLAVCLLFQRMAAAASPARARLAAVLVAVALLDLVAVGSHSWPNISEGDIENPKRVPGMETPDDAFAIIQRHAAANLPKDESYRIDTSDLGYAWQTMFPLRRIPSANGMNAVLLLDYANYRSSFSTPLDRQFRLDDARSPLLDLLNVRYVISLREEVPGLERIYKGWLKVFFNPRALPRFRLVGQVLDVKSPEEAVETLRSGDFDLRLAATVQAPVHPELSWQPGAPAPGSVRLVEYSPNKVQLEVEAGRPCLLVAAETYWPQWRARVDGVDQPIVRANAIQRGIFLSAGHHAVEMRLVPVKLYAGAAVSVLALLVIIAGLWLTTRGKRAGSLSASP